MLTTIVRRIAQVLIVGGLCLTVADGARAQTQPLYSEWGVITMISAGWSQDTMAVYHSPPALVNPSKCTVLNGGYATDPGDTGRGLFHSVALKAFMNKSQVQFVVLGCAFNKPKIIGVNVR